MQWISENWGTVLEWVAISLGAVAMVIGNINGEWARKLTPILAAIIAGIRRISPVKFKDEPGTMNVPIFRGDTKKVVAVVQDAP